MGTSPSYMSSPSSYSARRTHTVIIVASITSSPPHLDADEIFVHSTHLVLDIHAQESRHRVRVDVTRPRREIVEDVNMHPLHCHTCTKTKYASMSFKRGLRTAI